MIWSDEPQALFNGISARGTRLWGWTDDDRVSLSTNDEYQGEHKDHRITLRPNQGEELRQVQLSLSASNFNVAPDTRISWIPGFIPNSIELLQDGDGAWVVARDANGQLFNTTAWSEPKLDSSCARLVVFDADNPKDYFSGTLPADESVFRIQRSSPGAGVKDCEVTFSVKHKDVATRLTIPGTIKL